ncbi:hypothetical protein MMC34_002710 [Xylographa carneopallida]|nr:hypothetical protein [Xylographa carneopallida]
MSYIKSDASRDRRRLSNSVLRSTRRNSQPAVLAGHSQPAQQSHQLRTDGPEWEDYTFGGSQPVSAPPQTIYMDPPSAEEQLPRAERLGSAATIYADSAFRKFSLATTSSHTSYNVMQALREPRIAPPAPNNISPIPAATELGKSQNATTPLRMFNDGSSPIHVTNYDGNEDATPTPAERHRDIKRKLRLLFIYPLVYMLMWVLPFVMHCLQYTDYYSQNPPYVLAVFVTAILAVQGAVDSVLFSTREKPWRHLNNSSFRGWCTHWGKNKVLGESKEGKNSEEAAYDNHQALVRRHEEEVVLKDTEASEKPARPGFNRETSWWEQEGRMRLDSVMLGTDHNCAEHAGVETPHRTSTIQEEEAISLDMVPSRPTLKPDGK